MSEVMRPDVTSCKHNCLLNLSHILIQQRFINKPLIKVHEKLTGSIQTKCTPDSFFFRTFSPPCKISGYLDINGFTLNSKYPEFYKYKG